MGKIGEKLSLSIRESIREIKDRVSCFDVARFLGTDVKHGFARCGNERTPSCNVKKDIFHCHSCGKWGDVIDFYCHETGVDMKTAVRILDREFNIRILDTALDDAELEKIRLLKEKEEARRAYAQFWWRKNDFWRNKLISRVKTLEIFYRRLKPKYRSQLYDEENEFQLNLFLWIEKEMNDYDQIIDCLDEIQKETKYDYMFGFAYDKETAKERHWAILKAIAESEEKDKEKEEWSSLDKD